MLVASSSLEPRRHIEYVYSGYIYIIIVQCVIDDPGQYNFHSATNNEASTPAESPFVELADRSSGQDHGGIQNKPGVTRLRSDDE
jgi:hypothetical protein